MSLSVSPTLAELRQDVAIRLNMGLQARTSTAQHPLLDSFIRTAFNILLREANWAILDGTVEIPLTNAQHSYEVPDLVDVGSIYLVTVQDIYNREYPLSPGVAVYERNAYRVDLDNDTTGERASLPLRWEILNGGLNIYPAPDTEQYAKLIVYGRGNPREPKVDGDRPLIDGQSLILQATVIGKNHLNMPNADNEEQLLARQLRNIKSAQSDGESVQIGPMRSQRYAEAVSRVGVVGGMGMMGGAPRELFYPDYNPFNGIT